jgi:hypothetical protein
MSSVISFFLVRLLQRVETIDLVPEAHPAGTLPPDSWKSAAGRKSFERVWPKAHLTIFCNVRMLHWQRFTHLHLGIILTKCV